MSGFKSKLQLWSAAVFLLNLPCFSSVDSLARHQNKQEILTPTLHLNWIPNRDEPAVWNVLAGKNDEGGSWHSMITKSGNGVIFSKHLQLQGSFHGEVIHSNSEGKTGLNLLQHFEAGDQPYCFKMVISLLNRSDSAFVPFPADNLSITLGPGLGQTIDTLLSATTSNYSFVEPVAYLGGEVISYRDGTTLTRVLDWRSSRPAWAGLHDRYFALLILPLNPAEGKALLPFTRAVVSFASPRSGVLSPDTDFPVLTFKMPVAPLAPGQHIQWEFQVFSGPKSHDVLSSAPVNFDSLLFSGLWDWMRWICFGLLRLLTIIHLVIPGWGWSIIVLALIVRILLYPFAKKAMISQQRFVEAQELMLPELTEIKKYWKGGEQSERILQLYKIHNVSPFAGLKPLLIVLIQLPILIALFQVLGVAYELRDAGFLWIDTLAEPDKLFSFGFNIPFLGSYFNILPVLMAVVTLLSFRLSPAPTSEKKGHSTQNLFLIGMTLMFFFLFYTFPSGMVLYWTFANIFHILQYRMMKSSIK